MADVDFVALAKCHDGPRGPVEVLRGIDLHVPDGAFVVLVGPSGCGKSTLLRCVAGLETPSGGEVRIGGVRVNDVPPAARDVAMVFQGYALYPHMTVRENMGFALRLRKDPDTDARVEEVARMLGLTGLLDRLPRQLSGGQRQRVAMGRAIVRRPRVFLFDEPLSNLDAALRTQVRAELRRLHAQLGVTTLYVTHDQVEAMTLADRIVVLQGGTVQQEGTPQEVYDTPANRFVAGFVGTPGMAFLARLEPGAVVGVRPHAVVLGRGPHRGTVRFVERLGAEALVHLEREGEALAARVDGPGLASLPEVGAEVSFGLDAVHRFDPATGARQA
jgi:sn-glycerol 3-phosphate transport system ATP-binding protein